MATFTLVETAVVMLVAMLAIGLVIAAMLMRRVSSFASFYAEQDVQVASDAWFGRLRELVQFEREGRFLDAWKLQAQQLGCIHIVRLGSYAFLKVNDPVFLKDVMRVRAGCYHKSDMTRAYLLAVLGWDNLLLTCQRRSDSSPAGPTGSREARTAVLRRLW
jgi:hypothetical protein